MPLCRAKYLLPQTVPRPLPLAPSVPADACPSRDLFDEFQLETQGGGDGLQDGELDVLAPFDVPDGCLIGNASGLCQRVPG